MLTVCCDSHKDRRAFIRTLQNALVTRAEVTRMRNKYVTDEAVRERHRLLGQKRLGDLTTKITDSFPAPFLASSMSPYRSTGNLLTSGATEGKGREPRGAAGSVTFGPTAHASSAPCLSPGAAGAARSGGSPVSDGRLGPVPASDPRRQASREGPAPVRSPSRAGRREGQDKCAVQ